MINTIKLAFIFSVFIVIINSYPFEGSCDNLVPNSENCLLPFPNNFYTQKTLIPGGTGLRLRISEDTFPITNSGQKFEPAEWNKLDGFMGLPMITTYFPDLNIDNLPPHWEISKSLEENCPTVIINAKTLKKVPHYAELDQTTKNTEKRALTIWPSKRLESGERYIVAIRNLIDNTNELPIAPSDVFKNYRDNNTQNTRQNYFNTEIFPYLIAAGIEIDNLQIAWDFTVASRESTANRLLTIRNDGLSRLPGSGPKYYITDVKEFIDDDYLLRRIKGEIEVPYYTDKPKPGLSGCTLIVNALGNPVFQGWTNTSFTLQIPKSVTDQETSNTVVYGHGLFYSQKEIESTKIQEIGYNYKYIYAATNWWGMCEEDVAAITNMALTNTSRFTIVPDRSLQGFLNFMILTKLLKSENFINDNNLLVNGNPVLNPNNINYNGNSLGGIYGMSFMAINQDIINGALSVPGGSFSLILPRSQDFVPIFVILKERYSDPIDRINLMNILQLLWDRAGPGGYMDSLTTNPLPDTPSKRILIQYGLGDAQVSWLGALTMARSMGAVMFPDNVKENNEELFGFDVIDGPLENEFGATCQGFDYGSPEVPQTNVPPSGQTDTHSCPSRDQRAIDQMNALFTTNIFQNYCDGPCNLSTQNPKINSAKCNQEDNELNDQEQSFIESLFKKFL
eukprot:TRINITY_DN586_c0_g2_i1.p1 TRINITY_DN586_c0_g2~~TRINITY_DN586_c0_g2_i1.p1  ORF type:complete len:678 (-),score=197.51 TRINITY_DN586_c0_g2_i1:53-2086(-)